MKLNKKIVAGLATAVLFAPLALNNVQAHAEGSTNSDSNTGENSSIDKSKDKKAQLKQYLISLGASSDISDSKVQDVLSNLSQISNSYKDITQNTDNYQKPQFTSLLNSNNNDDTNHFIKQFDENNAKNIVNDISGKINDVNNISDKSGNYSVGHYKVEQLTNVLKDSKYNSYINTDKITSENIGSVISDINAIADSDAENMNSFVGSNNTNGFITKNDNGSTLKGYFSGDKSQIDPISGYDDTSNDYKAEQLKQLFNNDSNVNKDNIDSTHVKSILASIKSINSSKSNIENPTEENKKDGFKEILKQNNLERDTSINLDEHNTLTIGDRLSTINDIQSHTSSSAKPTVVITSSNNSNSNNTNQSSKPTETNNSNEVQFPSAPKSDNVVKDSHATKVNNAKSDVKKAEKQLANAKSNKAKNNAVKSINKAKANLSKLNGNQKSILKDAKKSVKKAEKQLKKAKTSDARKSANASLKAAQTNYTQLNKYIK